MSNVALIGLGNMGTPMSRRLVDAGNRVRGFDLVEAARERLRDGGGEPAATAAEAAAEATAVILMLPSSAIVESVVDELLAAGAIGPQTLVVDMSSSEPTRTQALAERLAAEGIAFADAPVSGGVRGAERGTLTIMLGARDADRERAHALLAPLGRVVDCGDVGAGHALKALNNLLSATHLWATSEAMQAGMRFGLDPEVMLSVFNGSSGKSGSTENKWPNFVLPGTFDSGFGLRLMLKDMRIATGLAEQVGTPSRLGADAVDLWAEAAEGLAPDADHTRVAEWIAAREVALAEPRDE
ncbi:NAD(P)-dependent oxidoreductase [Agrococcus jejuensis]|uniref:3-hydroxyisobutyrate dehydrogenase n=1 Tax=Agrococcus jejuensis TaxID=399736 RepID=A0A1G8CCL9_9MICO|nr:NAD(P)-dependent oxidoreductase [Agrococcus jejuensis]SDH42610.1 3-hydroxyisobutyrate dehydrogenase [Agrococcus jejuensis]